jgi:hypothetical protein
MDTLEAVLPRVRSPSMKSRLPYQQARKQALPRKPTDPPFMTRERRIGVTCLSQSKKGKRRKRY